MSNLNNKQYDSRNNNNQNIKKVLNQYSSKNTSSNNSLSNINFLSNNNNINTTTTFNQNITHPSKKYNIPINKCNTISTHSYNNKKYPHHNNKEIINNNNNEFISNNNNEFINNNNNEGIKQKIIQTQNNLPSKQQIQQQLLKAFDTQMSFGQKQQSILPKGLNDTNKNTIRSISSINSINNNRINKIKGINQKSNNTQRSNKTNKTNRSKSNNFNKLQQLDRPSLQYKQHKKAKQLYKQLQKQKIQTQPNYNKIKYINNSNTSNNNNQTNRSRQQSNHSYRSSSVSSVRSFHHNRSRSIMSQFYEKKETQKLVQKLITIKPSKQLSRQKQLQSYHKHLQSKHIMLHNFGDNNDNIKNIKNPNKMIANTNINCVNNKSNKICILVRKNNCCSNHSTIALKNIIINSRGQVISNNGKSIMRGKNLTKSKQQIKKIQLANILQQQKRKSRLSTLQKYNLAQINNNNIILKNNNNIILKNNNNIILKNNNNIILNNNNNNKSNYILNKNTSNKSIQYLSKNNKNNISIDNNQRNNYNNKNNNKNNNYNKIFNNKRTKTQNISQQIKLLTQNKSQSLLNRNIKSESHITSNHSNYKLINHNNPINQTQPYLLPKIKTYSKVGTLPIRSNYQTLQPQQYTKNIHYSKRINTTYI